MCRPNSKDMIRDINGVGGFLEDLPVLIFVLSGVVLIMGSIIWASEQSAAQAEQDELTSIANRLADSVAELAGGYLDDERYASIEHIRSLNASARAAEIAGGRSFILSTSQIHPCFVLLTSYSSTVADVPERAASATRLLNAIDEYGRVVAAEVRVVVW